jgi:hypothetical protein
LRSRVTFLGADVQVITCNQISEHSVDEPGRTSRPKSAGAWSGMLPSDPERAKSRRGPNTRWAFQLLYRLWEDTHIVLDCG